MLDDHHTRLLSKWATDAKPGDRFVYATRKEDQAPSALCMSAAWTLFKKGEVMLFQRRGRDRIKYEAVKVTPEAFHTINSRLQRYLLDLDTEARRAGRRR